MRSQVQGPVAFQQRGPRSGQCLLSARCRERTVHGIRSTGHQATVLRRLLRRHEGHLHGRPEELPEQVETSKRKERPLGSSATPRGCCSASSKSSANLTCVSVMRLL